jgi:preprotein translocase subunit SecF
LNYILGVPSIKQFALPMIIGIVFAIYSSVFIAAQLWVVFVKGEEKKA